MKIQTTVETEIEVTYPQYRKFGSPLYKLLSDQDSIAVIIDETSENLKQYKINISKGFDSTVAMVFSQGEEITEDEFNKALHLALFQINQPEYIRVAAPRQIVHFETENA